MKLIATCMLMALVTALAACEDPPVPPPAATRRAPPPPPPPPVIEAEGEIAQEAYVYRSEGKRDPFRSFQLQQEEEPEISFGPLGDYDLSQLSVVAVIWDTRNPRALVTDPGGRSFMITTGSRIGKNDGRVLQIEDDLVLVQERFIDFEGNRTTAEVEMRMHRSRGG